MRLRVVHLPVQGELENLARPYMIVLDRVPQEFIDTTSPAELGRFTEHSGGLCHGIIAYDGELEIE